MLWSQLALVVPLGNRVQDVAAYPSYDPAEAISSTREFNARTAAGASRK